MIGRSGHPPREIIAERDVDPGSVSALGGRLHRASAGVPGHSLEEVRQSVVISWEVSMGNLLFWLGIGAAQTSDDAKEVKPTDHRVLAGIAITVLALLMVGALLIFVGGAE